MTEIKEIQIQSLAEPAQIKLIRYTKGYGWELNLHSVTLTKAAEEIKRIDDLFRDRYGSEQKSTEYLTVSKKAIEELKK